MIATQVLKFLFSSIACFVKEIEAQGILVQHLLVKVVELFLKPELKRERKKS